MLINRTVQAAVFETSPRHILTEGLPYDRCQIGVVMAMPGAAGLADLYITDDEQMPNVVRTQVDVVLPQGASVLNADDPHVLELAEYSDGEVLLYSLEPDHPALAAHRARKGRALVARGQQILLLQGAETVVQADLGGADFSAFSTDLPEDIRPHVLAAAGAAWALGVPVDLIHAGLLRFGEPQSASLVH